MKKLTDADRFRDLLGRATREELESMRSRLEDAMLFRFPSAVPAPRKRKKAEKTEAAV